jgi:thiazole synthase
VPSFNGGRLCEVLMPWAAPIGTGQRPRNPAALRELPRRVPHILLIVDARIGLPSHACQVMEWGFDAVLLNTAVSRAPDPVCMAGAFAESILAGHDAYRAGPMAVQKFAVPSTPEMGLPFSEDTNVGRQVFPAERLDLDAQLRLPREDAGWMSLASHM